LLERRFELVACPQLLDELSGVLLRDKFRRYVTQDEVRQFVAGLAAVATVVDDPKRPPRVARDPYDDYLVALAAAERVDALVSGDHDLTELADTPVLVVTPRAFMEQLRADEGESAPRP
jgi:putative PIN family toxin of toxin-antitoxin system